MRKFWKKKKIHRCDLLPHTTPLKNNGNKRNSIFCYKIQTNWSIWVRFGQKLWLYQIYRMKEKNHKNMKYFNCFYCSLFFLLFLLFSIIISKVFEVILRKIVLITFSDKVYWIENKKLKNNQNWTIFYCYYFYSIVSWTIELMLLSITSEILVRNF